MGYSAPGVPGSAMTDRGCTCGGGYDGRVLYQTATSPWKRVVSMSQLQDWQPGPSTGYFGGEVGA